MAFCAKGVPMNPLMTLCWFLLGCGLALWLTLTYADQLDGDWTDTGVGCIEDCLEPEPSPQPTAISLEV